MPYQIQAPPAALAPFVEYFWSLRDAPAHARGSVLPSGTLGLVVNLDEDQIRVYDPDSVQGCRRFSGAFVSGAYSRAFIADAREHASVVETPAGRGSAPPTPTARRAGPLAPALRLPGPGRRT